MTSHLDPLFFEEEQNNLTTDALQMAFGQGYNKFLKIQSSKEFYLERENLASLIYNESLRTVEQSDKLSDAIIQSFNAGQLLRVKEKV